jgi:hypothetical protein
MPPVKFEATKVMVKLGFAPGSCFMTLFAPSPLNPAIELPPMHIIMAAVAGAVIEQKLCRT